MQNVQNFGKFCYDPYQNLAVKLKRFSELNLLAHNKGRPHLRARLNEILPRVYLSVHYSNVAFLASPFI